MKNVPHALKIFPVYHAIDKKYVKIVHVVNQTFPPLNRKF